MKELTKAEEQVMHYLWEMGKGFLKDIVEQFPEPRPAYTTISTVIRVLVKKEFIGFNTYGKVHEYYTKVSKRDYFKRYVQSLINNHFEGSAVDFASFFAGNRDMDITELEEIKKVIDQKLDELKQSNQ